MVIIPICIFTIAYRDKESALGREGGKEEAMATLRILVLFRVSGGWLDARCPGGDFESLFYAVFVELSNGRGRIVEWWEAFRLLNRVSCTYFAKKIQAVTVKQTQSE